MRRRAVALGVALLAAAAAPRGGATPHSALLSSATPRAWWDGTRAAFGYGPRGTAVTPEDPDAEGAKGTPLARASAAPSPAQRQSLQGIVAEYVIYLKYLSLRNFLEGPVDWRSERFLYASLVPLRDLSRPDAPFRADPERIASAIREIRGILAEIGEPAVALLVEALKNDVLYGGAAKRRAAPLNYREAAGVEDSDYNVRALEQFDDVGYGLGNFAGWIEGNGLVRNADYRTWSEEILLRIGRAALADVEKAARHEDARVHDHFAKLADRIKAGEAPAADGGGPSLAPPGDPEAVSRAERERKDEEKLGKLYALWNEAEAAREKGDRVSAIALYRKILASQPPLPYEKAARERLAGLAPDPGEGGAPGDGGEIRESARR